MEETDPTGTAIRITEGSAICLGCNQQIESMYEIPCHMVCAPIEPKPLKQFIYGETWNACQLLTNHAT